MFKFVSDNVGGVGTKRKQGPKSCESCKKRHKRCSHTHQAQPEQSPNPSRRSPLSPQDTHSQAACGHQPDSPVDQHAACPVGLQEKRPHNLSEDAHLRFVSDLSPEASFLMSANRQNADRNISRHQSVGVWLGQKHGESLQPCENDIGVSAHSVAASGGSTLLSNLRPALRRECIATLPPEYEFDLLSRLFFDKIYPVFPILSDKSWDSHGVMEAVALKQCVCLVASSDPSVKQHLRLPHTDRVLSQLEFQARVAAAVKQSLDLGFVNDKLVLVQVCALMALYVDRPGCGVLSTHFCALAVQHLQTLGLHLGWPDGRTGGAKAHRIFWCVWVMDRLNAAANARPILIHSQDVDKKIMSYMDTQEAPFRLLIRIAHLLDDVISLYRPHAVMSDHSTISDNCTFEDLVEETSALEIGNDLLGTLELFYLSVMILRGKPATHKEPNRTPSSELQWFSAVSIVSGASESHVYWPILPHSVSLAAAVACRSLLNSAIPFNRKRAYALLHSCWQVLDELSKAFVSAQTMALLAKDTLQEVERVAVGKNRKDETQEATRATKSTGTNGTLQEQDQQPTGSEQPFGGTPPFHDCGPEPFTNSLASPIASNFFDGFEGGAGIFGDFDPSFDLERIDAILSANLNLDLPHFQEDWLNSDHVY